MIKKALCALPLALALAGTTSANTGKTPEDILDALAAKSKSQYLVQSPQNRMMMPDNPAYDVIEEGEKLWKQKRGPKNATLDQCDFGKGPGVLKGAYVELPRYFADTGKVMDLESRLVYCMKTLQGYADDAPEIKKRHGNDAVVTKLMSYIAYQSSGMPWNPPMNHPLEKAMRNAGEVLFYRRSGTMDFNCATCHTVTGGRIRASYLPNVKVPEEWTKAISWPAYRTSQESVRSSQHRVLECLWQMRYPNIRPDSDVNIALISFWTDAARGQPAILPDLKR
ncbi:MAG: sulfur oxidation c-type cytochrome SoxA [Thiobacillaceae bacterium]